MLLRRGRQPVNPDGALLQSGGWASTQPDSGGRAQRRPCDGDLAGAGKFYFLPLGSIVKTETKLPDRCRGTKAASSV
jgi:hypothetical protein